MIDWLLTQTLTLSFCIAILVSIYKPAIRHIGAQAYYWSWLIIPLQFAFSTTGLVPTTAPQAIENYVVSAAQSINTIQATISSAPSLWVVLWMIGAFLTMAYFVFQHLYAHGNLICTPIELPQSQHILSGDTPIYQSANIQSPMVTGLLSPRIIVPITFIQQPKVIQDLLIEHELVHIRRGDLWWNSCAILILTLFWFNPFAWVGYRFLRQAQELACDSAVLKTKCRVTRLHYAKAFLEQSVLQQRMAFTSLYYGGKKNMKDRINNMRERKHNKLFAIPLAAVLLTLIPLSQAISGNQMVSKKTENRSIHPVMRVEPIYPKEAAEQGIEGSVVLQFSIKTDGTVDDIHIIKSTPEDVFDHSAAEALSQWTYTKPSSTMKNMLVQLDYVLSEKSQENLLSNLEQINVAPNR